VGGPLNDLNTALRLDQPVRALVVEDDPSWQGILSEILSEDGLQVDLAGSYEQALAQIRAHTHRLAILDLSLGGPDHHNQDGMRVAEAVRRFDPGCNILFLTGFATVELAVQVMRDLNALTCLRKETFRRAEFRKVIKEALKYAPGMPNPVAQTNLTAGRLTEGAAPVRSGLPQENAQGVILVVEDDAGWRSLYSEILEDAGYRVRTCGSYVEAVGQLKREQVALAVVDLALASSLDRENLDGYRLLAGMQKAGVPVIVVSGYVVPERIEQAYRERLIYACLEKQAFDRKSFRQTVENALIQEDPVLKSLTDREREVLVLLARGLANKEIARDLVITPNTVKRHLKSLFAKLDVSTRSAASAKAIGMGLGKEE
jgi:DNA-binding NarL/FixJ family response regulator